MKNIADMTPEEKKQRKAELLAELKELNATPRSDWHAAFESILRIDTSKFRDKVIIRTEEELGSEPPRVDYLVLIEEAEVDLEKEIFEIFRRFNIIEYKNPNDSLNERVLYKIVGYANFYIGLAEHEGDVTPDQVTISIFRATKNPELFDKLEAEGSLRPSDTVKGIYYVEGFTHLPFQIVITSELEGPTYAAYRALTDKASEVDIEAVMGDYEKAANEAIRESNRILLRLYSEKNPEVIETIRRTSAMTPKWMEIFKEEIDEKVNTAVDEKEQQTIVSSIKNLMTNLQLSVDKAMDALGIPQNQREKYAGLVKGS